MTKTPAELNAEWERIAADLGDGIADTVETAVAEAVRKERAAVVAYLRTEAADGAPQAEAALLDVADDIDRGEHRPKEKP